MVKNNPPISVYLRDVTFNLIICQDIKKFIKTDVSYVESGADVKVMC